MKYERIEIGRFIERPNRFIAYVEIAGKKETVHVKNTGRCAELLTPNASVYVQRAENPDRKTQWDLIGVKKGKRMINMDSQIPNKVVEEWIKQGNLFPDAIVIRPEKTYRKSRFDLYVEEGDRKIFVEVKGVTLEENGIVKFPDAPTERGIKHIEELCEATKEGYEAYIFFVIQMKGVRYFTPNMETQPAFGEALKRAKEQGVHVLAYDCKVGKDSIEIGKEVPVLLEDENLKKIADPLVTWYRENKRELPWREQISAYRVWVSEIMLQQTRVEAVKPYFQRFITELPDIQSLAECPEEKLLKLWEGLGYYNRVRNMQEAAKTVKDEYNGRLPEDYQALLSLKGIGSYTAGAIASIAYGEKVPAVDGNVLRVISRITESTEDISRQSVRRKIEQQVSQIMPSDCPGDFNQALMELGAVICVPNGQAKCAECPIAFTCLAHRHDKADMIPVKAPKKARTQDNRTVFIIQDGECTAIRKRPEKGLLAGLYELPNIQGHLKSEDALLYVKELGLDPLYIEELPPAKHIFSHIEWRMQAYRIKVSSLKTTQDKELIFVSKEQSGKQYAIPSAFGAYAKYIKEETR